MKKKVYILENLGCANCASKIEHKAASLPGVKEATITFATKQLRLIAEDPDSLISEIQKIANSLEPDIKITEQTRRGTNIPQEHEEHHHEHTACCCGHEHSHKEHHHHHKHDSCCCGHEHSHEEHHHHEHAPQAPEAAVRPGFFSWHSKTLLTILLGTALFIAGEVLDYMQMEIPSILLLVIAYILLGGRIILTAAKNMIRGQIFDENFLMSLATLGAFAIQEYPEAVGVMLFYRIGEFFEHIAVEKSRSQIMDAVDMRPEVVNLVIGDEIKVIDAGAAKAGDILLIRPGDRIPLDGVVAEGESRIDTSPVTGEPVPVKAGSGDEVISGCVNTSGLLKIRVEKVLEESMVTRILDSVENAAASKPKIDRFITKFARIYTPVVVILAACTAIIPSLASGNWNYWVYTALSFLVMSCPCALVLSVPLAFFSGIGAGSRRGILFKGGVSLEAMKNIRAVVMDKTGTITKGNFVLQETMPSKNCPDADTLLSWCAGCELSSTHPIGNSIVSAAKDRNLKIIRPSSVEEIPGYGIRAVFPEGEILCGSKKLMDKYHVSMEEFHSGSYGTQVMAAKDGIFMGALVISDTLKEDAHSAVSQIKKMGIATVMLTGDTKESADAVAVAAGIEEVCARLLPQDKLTELTKIRSSHGPVMFVGDGINDAPVLAGADVGAAMGSGADAALEAADVVFMTSDVEAIPQSLSIARATSRISWQNVIFALIIKVFVMILGLCGFASMWMAVFADTGVAMLCILNSIRILYKKK